MDLLYKRYADPFSLLTGYIQTSRFGEFLLTFCRQVGEDQRWEFFLHKVWDKSYADFCAAQEAAAPPKPMSEADMEATVRESMRILRNFNPEEGEA